MNECAICGGTPDEHTPDKSKHVFTTKPGDLKTWAEAESEARRKAASTPPPTRIPMPAGAGMDSQMFGRLMVKLREKGILDDADTLFVMLGQS